ncbi:esterase family protein, partial [Burkholderia territorii]
MRRLALPFAAALIAGAIATAHATPGGPAVSPASSAPAA